MKRTNFDDFYLFQQVAKLQSISSAAEHLNLSIATISRRLVTLEDELNLKLFNRTRRSLTLTNDGEHYYQKLSPLLEQLGEEIDLLRYANSSPVGHLRISLPNFLYEQYLMTVIEQFQKEYPKIKITLSSTYDREVDIADDIDITFRVREPTSQDLISKTLLNLDQIFISTQPPTRKFKLDTFELVKTWLDSKDIIYYFDSINLPMQIKGDSHWYHYRANEQKLMLKTFSMIKTSLNMENTLTFVPKSMVQQELQSGQFVEVLSNWIIPNLPVNMIYRSRKQLPSHQRLFIDAITAYFSNLNDNNSLLT
ncbi:LysR family transcriptional regulator [Vibrio sp. SS-MA-C1-2]|uniref:LysR family transcriptional regulator n=1 Tax=Vibrio sp. SS-MA-C1-2 TaxID=2908646 RepID=UPI001F36B2BB|nr:LysR family transcriptional regulator [Vibrio sp. SS-MA-C1-2]UJF17994.1 LysR family transcriptional regulator [Vibrio sp. SS-MA-C1-2]